MNIQDSLDKILNTQDVFGEIFYDVFFDQYPEAETYFRGMDMHRQALVLTMSLKLVEEYSLNGYLAIEKYLEYLGNKHSDRGIPKELYPKWRDSMLVALKRFHGDEWTDALGSEWRLAIDGASDVLFRGYDHRSPF